MPLHHAVLALLAHGSSHGYELKTTFEESIGPQWGELNIGHLYQVLDRLVRDEMVKKREVAQTARPDKTVYSLTASGRQELERWLTEPFVRQGGYRDDFFLKLFAASRLGKQEVDQVVRVQREAYLAELSSLSELRSRYVDDPLVHLLVEAAVLHTEANLRIVELAEAEKLPIARRAGKSAQASTRSVAPETDERRSDGTAEAR